MPNCGYAKIVRSKNREANMDNEIDRGKGILVAISGGADSVAMLHNLVSKGYYCIAAH